MKILQGRAPRYWEAFMRAFSVRGPLPDQVQEPVQLGITMADLTGYENAYLRRETLWSAGQLRAAVAAEFFYGGLVSSSIGPVTSRCIADQILVTFLNPTAAVQQFDYNVVVGPGFPALTGRVTQQGNPTDRRITKLPAVPNSVYALVSGTNAAVLTSVGGIVIVPAGSCLVMPMRAVLLDNGLDQGLIVGCTTANAISGVSFQWRERIIQPEEA